MMTSFEEVDAEGMAVAQNDGKRGGRGGGAE